MEIKFKETHIPEDFSKALAKQSLLLGPAYVSKVAQVIFHGVSTVLARGKSTSVPRGVIFRNIDHSFIAGAKVQYIANGDDPSNGRWDYTWTFYEDDMKDADCDDAAINSTIATIIAESGSSLYNMKFASNDLTIIMSTVMLDLIRNWLKENAKDNPTLVLDGVFTATSAIEDNEVVIGLVPSGEMKVIIKDDAAIQEN